MDYCLLSVASYTLEVCYHTPLSCVNETNSVSPNFSHSLCVYRFLFIPVPVQWDWTFYLKIWYLSQIQCKLVSLQQFWAQQSNDVWHVTSSATVSTFYKICFLTGASHFSFTVDFITFRSSRLLLPFWYVEFWLLLPICSSFYFTWVNVTLLNWDHFPGLPRPLVLTVVL